MMYMPIIDINKPSGQELFRQYMDKKIVPLAYEVCWQQETPEVRKCMKDILAQGSKIWVNTLWASLCGGEELVYTMTTLLNTGQKFTKRC